jgi:hypothetical protein
LEIGSVEQGCTFEALVLFKLPLILENKLGTPRYAAVKSIKALSYNRLAAKESAIAKSKGSNDETDMSPSDASFLKVLHQKIKIPKFRASYTEQRAPGSAHCVKCKFNLGDEAKCHIVKGKINNENGVSKFFSSKGDGMLPGDIVWMYVKQSGMKLKYKEGYVIRKGAPGFQCKDCKYYLYSRKCLLIEGRFTPRMSCGFIVLTSHGTEI